MSTSSSEPAGPGRYATLVEALLAAPPEREFAAMWLDEDEVQRVTFGAFTRRARRFAGLLSDGRAGPGDRVLLLLPQGIDLMAAFAGAMLVGAVPAILAYPQHKVEPAKYRHGLAGVVAHLAARVILVDEDFPPDLLECLSGPGMAPLLTLRRTVPAADASLPLAAPDPSAAAFIQHSAGTTGLQKGVALSHRAVLTQLAHLAEALRLSLDDRIYSWLPLYHDMGLIACFMLPLAAHLPVVMQSPTDWVMQPASMLEQITRERCTLAWMPNFAFQFLARRVRPADRQGLDLSSMRAFVNCSEPVRARSLDEFQAAYAGCGLRRDALHASYAMAENVFAVTQTALDRGAARRVWVDAARLRDDQVAAPVAVPAAPGTADATCLVSSGRCLAGNEVRIEAAAPGSVEGVAVGEILIRSDSLFDGYVARPDLTRQVLQDGWYHSGDLGLVLEDELYVVGRRKDLIIVAGKNVHPQDVEEIACEHPAIHDGRAIALGLFNPQLGTEEIVVVAEVEPSASAQAPAGAQRSEAIERAVQRAVTAELGVTVRRVLLKPPRWIVKSTAGKPARSDTRAKLLREHPELAGGRAQE